MKFHIRSLLLLLTVLFTHNSKVYGDFSPAALRPSGDAPFRRSKFQGLYFPLGISVSFAIPGFEKQGQLNWDNSVNVQFGIEGALTYLYLLKPNSHWYELLWGGLYFNGLYMFGPEVFRISVGPQLGWSILGVEVGYLAAISSVQIQHGVTARLTISFFGAGLYVAYSHLFPDDSFWEVGLLLRVPIPLTLKW